jgi:hypothetical protein
MHDGAGAENSRRRRVAMEQSVRILGRKLGWTSICLGE